MWEEDGKRDEILYLGTLIDLTVSTLALCLELECGIETEAAGHGERGVLGGVLFVDLLDCAVALDGFAVDCYVEPG